MNPAATVPDRVRWTVDLIDVRPTDHVLEIGCGPGHAVALVCDRLNGGTITAIDRSPIMVARARERNRACIADGIARVERRALAKTSFERRFPKIFAINVNAFWTEPVPSIGALHSLLHPAGTAFLTYQPPAAARLKALRGSLPELLAEQGLEVRDIRQERLAGGDGICLMAVSR